MFTLAYPDGGLPRPLSATSSSSSLSPFLGLRELPAVVRLGDDAGQEVAGEQVGGAGRRETATRNKSSSMNN